jgi:CDP-6-deoxy-D-xylo-4-hexulose-3-dehydrase
MQYEIHGTLKNADLIHNNGFFVGNHHYDLSKEIEYLSEVLGEIM